MRKTFQNVRPFLSVEVDCDRIEMITFVIKWRENLVRHRLCLAARKVSWVWLLTKLCDSHIKRQYASERLTDRNLELPSAKKSHASARCFTGTYCVMIFCVWVYFLYIT